MSVLTFPPQPPPATGKRPARPLLPATANWSWLRPTHALGSRLTDTKVTSKSCYIKQKLDGIFTLLLFFSFLFRNRHFPRRLVHKGSQLNEKLLKMLGQTFIITPGAAAITQKDVLHFFVIVRSTWADEWRDLLKDTCTKMQNKNKKI